MSAEPYQLAHHRLQQLRRLDVGTSHQRRQQRATHQNIVRIRKGSIEDAEMKAKQIMLEEDTKQVRGLAREASRTEVGQRNGKGWREVATFEQQSGRKRQREPHASPKPDKMQPHWTAPFKTNNEYQVQRTAQGLLVVKKDPAIKQEHHGFTAMPHRGSVVSSIGSKMLPPDGLPRFDMARNPSLIKTLNMGGTLNVGGHLGSKACHLSRGGPVITGPATRQEQCRNKGLKDCNAGTKPSQTMHDN